VAAEVLARFDPRDLLVSATAFARAFCSKSARVQLTVADPGAARERSVRQFAERCHYEEPHAHQVRKLALQLFDALSSHLQLGATDRQILSDAALLHDVGYHINYEKHHKHSFHLISHAELLGMTPAEQVAIAHVARYHRVPLPSARTGPLRSSIVPCVRAS
jgi:exopolyphosphatase / guanosine-5'-triphosphate,3'-diphosphate pyrophosphatase